MVQPIDGASSPMAQAPGGEAPRQVTADQPADSGGIPAGAEQATQEFVGAFLMQVFMMTNQEADKIRKETERLHNELREEE